jgi:HAMP domain-containing protein
MIKLNRIGNKLGLAGAVGVLLAIGMVANQMATESRIEEGSARAARSQQVANNALSAHIDLRKIQLAAGDVRLARTPAEVEKALSDLQRHKASAAKELEAALAIAQRPEAKEQLQKTKGLMEGFAAAVEDLAKAQTTLLAQIQKRSAISEEWNKSIDSQLKLPAMQKLDNRLEIERLLFQADGKVNALRAAAWKLGATGDAKLVTEMAKTEASLKDVFNKLRGEADDRDLLVVVSNLSSIVKRFLAANEEAVRTEQSKGEIIATRTVKAAADVAHLMEETVAGAQKDAKISKDAVMSDTERANRINLIMAIVVVMSLIASVVFSFLGVARPMTRLNGALGRMAAGDLDVEIPGAGRGDEIGDLAKTVTVIRENAEHKAREEAGVKVEQDQVAAKRRKAE